MQQSARDPDNRLAALSLSFLAGPGHGLCLAHGHAVGTDAFSCQIRVFAQIRQFHAPTMILAGRRTAVELCAAFVACQLLHRRLPQSSARIVGHFTFRCKRQMQMTSLTPRGRHLVLSVINPRFRAGVAELVDALDLKSRDPGSWGFESPRPHQAACSN